MDELRKEHRQQQRLHGWQQRRQQRNDLRDLQDQLEDHHLHELQQLRVSTEQCLRYANPKFQAIQKPCDQHDEKHVEQWGTIHKSVNKTEVPPYLAANSKQHQLNFICWKGCYYSRCFGFLSQDQLAKRDHLRHIHLLCMLLLYRTHT